MALRIPNRTRARGFKMLTIMNFLDLLPGIRRGLARRRILEWDIFAEAIDDVFPIANLMFKGKAPYFYLGSRAAQKILAAYHAGQFEMKPGATPQRAAEAQNYIDAEHRVPPYYDDRLKLVRDESGKVILRATDAP